MTEIEKRELIKVLMDKAKKGTVILVYGARDEKHNEALLLKQFLEKSEQGTAQMQR